MAGKVKKVEEKGERRCRGEMIEIGGEIRKGRKKGKYYSPVRSLMIYIACKLTKKTHLHAIAKYIVSYKENWKY